MLQTIREHTQGWIAGIIITIIILTFAMWGIHSYFVGGTNDSNVAEVNGVTITKEQLAVAYERFRRQEQSQYSGKSNLPEDEKTLKNRALQALINIEVLKQASLKQGFRISNHQIDDYLQSMPAFQIGGRFSIDRFQEILSSTLLSISEFLDLIRTSLLIDQPKLGIILSSFALPYETENSIALINQERDIDYTFIPLSYFLSQAILISPRKIQAYYDQNQSEFMTPEQLSVDYIELSFKDLAAKMNPPEEVLKNFYNENLNAYTQAMRWKINSIEIPLTANAIPQDLVVAQDKLNLVIKALKQGKHFPQIASDYATKSVDEHKWLTLNQVPSEWQRVVVGLTRAGQISAPFKTAQGFVILQTIGIQEPKIEAFAEVKDKVREAYIRQHTEGKFAELRDQLADATYEHPDSLQFASNMLNLPIKTSELFTKDKIGKDIAQYKKVRDAAFSNDVLALQNNSDLIQVNPETVFVLRVKSHLPATLLPLTEVSKQIEDKLKAREAAQRAERFANDLQKKLQAGANPQQLTSLYHGSWKKIGLTGRYSTQVDSAVLDLAFRLPRPQWGATQQQTVYGVTKLPSGYAIIALKAVKDGEMSDSKQQAVFAEQIQNSEGLFEYELYKLSQMKHAKIKILS